MKKQILNFGKQLSKNEQKEVFGGSLPVPGSNGSKTCIQAVGIACTSNDDCCGGTTCKDTLGSSWDDEDGPNMGAGATSGVDIFNGGPWVVHSGVCSY